MPRISSLPASTDAAADDELPIVDVSTGATRKATVSLIMPTGSILDFAGTIAPSGWLFCYGQALNGTTNVAYANLYAVIGNTYGGTSINDFVVPDLRGRAVAGKDDMGGSSANRLTNLSGGVNGDVLGGTGGAETHTLITAELALHTHSVDNTMSFTITDGASNLDPAAIRTGANSGRYDTNPQNMGATSGSSGSDTAHNNVQPTIILNKIIKY